MKKMIGQKSQLPFMTLATTSITYGCANLKMPLPSFTSDIRENGAVLVIIVLMELTP